MALAVRILEELAKKGYKVEAKLANETTEAVEGLVARAKTGKLDPATIGFKEGTAINKMTETLLSAMKKPDGTLSRSAVLDLHQAYSSAAIKEFGRGANAEAALEAFKKTVSTTWKETRPTTVSDSRLTVAAAERDARRVTAVPTSDANVVAVGPARQTGGPVRAAGEPRQTGGEVRVVRPPEPATPLVEVGRGPVAPTPARPEIADEVVDGVVPPKGARAEPDVIDANFREVPEGNPGFIDPEPGDFPAGVRQRPAAPQAPVEPPAAAQRAPEPEHHGHTGHATSEEIAARERVLAEDRIKFRDSTYGARSDVTKGLREFEGSTFTEKKAAFDKVANNIEGSGLIARPGSAEEAKAIGAAGQAAGQQRSVDDVRKILLSRPGQDGDGNFINGVITVDEWTALRKSMRGDLLQTEQQSIFSRVDQARLGNKRIDTMSSDMARLREIMLDPDFNPVPKKDDQGRIIADSHRMSPDGLQASLGGKPRSSFSDIEGDLRAGKPVSPSEIDKLAVSYKRWYASAADQKAENASPGKIGQAIDGIGRGANAIFRPVDRHLERVPFVPRVAPVAGGLVGSFLLASALSVPATYFSPDNEIPVMGDLGRRVATNLPFGFSGNVPGASWLPEIYFSKMESDADYRKRVMDATPDEIARMNSSQQQARTVLVERANLERDQRTKDEASRKGLSEQQVQTGAVDAARQVAAFATGASSPPAAAPEKGASAEDVDKALTQMYRDGAIDADHLDKMAAELAKKGAVVTKQELGEVAAENAVTKGVPVTGYQQLEKILGPKMTP